MQFCYSLDENGQLMPEIINEPALPEDFSVPCNSLKYAGANVCPCQASNISCCQLCKCKAEELCKNTNKSLYMSFYIAGTKFFGYAFLKI